MPISEEGREAMGDEARLPVAGEDPVREEEVHDLVNEPARPLTETEEEAAERDPGRSERVYAPASARVPKEPAPGDDRLIEGGEERPAE
jgi:hypothetical protein